MVTQANAKHCEGMKIIEAGALGASCESCPELSSKIMAAAHLSPLTIHVLNTGDGIAAARMALSLHRLDSRLMIWNMISVGTTDEDGHCPGLIAHTDFLPGLYKLRFETGPYWESLGHISFYPYVEVVFLISEGEERFHLPLLLSRFSYSTYRS